MLTVPDMNRLTSEAGLPKWKLLYQITAVAIIVMLTLIPIQIAVFTIWPMPTAVTDWFALFQKNSALGLIHLDLLYIVNNIIVAVMYVALYFSLRQRNEVLMLIALLTCLLGVAAYFSSNPAFEMLILSRQYAAASAETEKTILMAAGQVMLSQWKGTAFDIYYILNGVSLIILSGVMFKSMVFSRLTAAFGLASGILMLIPSSAGTFGKYFALASLIPWVIFSACIAQRYFKLTRLQSSVIQE